MSAKEMFEQLGFECDCSQYMIIYEEEKNENYFAFLLRKKEIESVCKFDFYKKHEKEINEAIHQQLKELHWIED